ncbi:MAG: Ni/Fe-hydrogenase, b-type cytochrome subunit [Bacteroidota bacterium]
MSITYNYKRVYVWEIPVRLFHWLTVLAMIALIITGFIIADPPAINENVEPSQSFKFGIVRFIHFTSGFVLVANFLFRVYWSFVGNRFAKWTNFIPFTKAGIKNIIHVLKVDILLLKDKEHKLSNISIGHNMMASFSYFMMTIVFLIQLSTGFALMSQTSDFWFTEFFSWVLPLLGGDITVRYIHHFLTWIFLAFILVHVYLVFFHDYVEARGETSSMLSGYKFVRAERISKGEVNIEEEIEEE